MKALNGLRWLLALLSFICFYGYELLLAAFRIAWDVVTVTNYSKPGFVDLPLDAKTDLELSVVANLITYSPGTFVAELSEDRSSMRVHVMFLDDEAEQIRQLKDNLERRVLEVLRWQF